MHLMNLLQLWFWKNIFLFYLMVKGSFFHIVLTSQVKVKLSEINFSYIFCFFCIFRILRDHKEKCNDFVKYNSLSDVCSRDDWDKFMVYLRCYVTWIWIACTFWSFYAKVLEETLAFSFQKGGNKIVTWK